jgi:hypothetical protein
MSCGLVLYRDYDYCGGRKVDLPYRSYTEHNERSVSVIDFQVESWNNWLKNNMPRIYPSD